MGAVSTAKRRRVGSKLNRQTRGMIKYNLKGASLLGLHFQLQSSCCPRPSTLALAPSKPPEAGVLVGISGHARS